MIWKTEKSHKRKNPLKWFCKLKNHSVYFSQDCTQSSFAEEHTDRLRGDCGSGGRAACLLIRTLVVFKIWLHAKVFLEILYMYMYHEHLFNSKSGWQNLTKCFSEKNEVVLLLILKKRKNLLCPNQKGKERPQMDTNATILSHTHLW